jgi:hypothetical protein
MDEIYAVLCVASIVVLVIIIILVHMKSKNGLCACGSSIDECQCNTQCHRCRCGFSKKIIYVGDNDKQQQDDIDRKKESTKYKNVGTLNKQPDDIYRNMYGDEFMGDAFINESNIAVSNKNLPVPDSNDHHLWSEYVKNMNPSKILKTTFDPNHNHGKKNGYIRGEVWLNTKTGKKWALKDDSPNFAKWEIIEDVNDLSDHITRSVKPGLVTKRPRGGMKSYGGRATYDVQHAPQLDEVNENITRVDVV